jgi:hypothetical protein
MRFALRPLHVDGDACEAVGIGSADSRTIRLWHARLDWNCRDAPLALRVLAPEPVALPAPEISEPVPGAIARCLRDLSGSGALLLLANPAAALGPSRIAMAEGIRLMAIADEADEACWDALLALGQPCYGVRGEVQVEVLRPRPANLLSALSFGAFTCHEGLAAEIDEGPRHVAWTCAATVEAEIIGRGGFAVDRRSGASGRYDDRGGEGSVRAVLRSAAGACWTQPRLVAARRESCHA